MRDVKWGLKRLHEGEMGGRLVLDATAKWKHRDAKKKKGNWGLWLKSAVKQRWHPDRGDGDRRCPYRCLPHSAVRTALRRNYTALKTHPARSVYLCDLLWLEILLKQDGWYPTPLKAVTCTNIASLSSRGNYKRQQVVQQVGFIQRGENPFS